MTKIDQSIRVSLAALLMAAVAGFMWGCKDDKPAAQAAPVAADTAPPPPAKPVALSQIKSELIESKAQIQATTDSLNKLQKSPTADATANYNAYSEQYLKLKSKADSVKVRANDLKTRASAYLANWHQQANVENPALRRQAIQQEADAEKLFNTLTSEMELTRIEFNPYLANLTDVGKYLNNNLTPASLESTSELVEKANSQAKSVNQHIDGVIVALDQMATATGESGAAAQAPAPGETATAK